MRSKTPSAKLQASSGFRSSDGAGRSTVEQGGLSLAVRRASGHVLHFVALRLTQTPTPSGPAQSSLSPRCFHPEVRCGHRSLQPRGLTRVRGSLRVSLQAVVCPRRGSAHWSGWTRCARDTPEEGRSRHRREKQFGRSPDRKYPALGVCSPLFAGVAPTFAPHEPPIRTYVRKTNSISVRW